MVFSEAAARQERERKEAAQRAYAPLVEKRMRALNISRQLAQHLVDIETRINNLEERR